MNPISTTDIINDIINRSGVADAVKAMAKNALNNLDMTKRVFVFKGLTDKIIKVDEIPDFINVINRTASGKWSDIVEGWSKFAKAVVTTYSGFSKPIKFGGDIVKTEGKTLNLLGRVNPADGSIGTQKIFTELKRKGVPESEMTGLFTPMLQEYKYLSILEQNAKYWKEINKPHIDNIIANGGDIRFIHDPRLEENMYNVIKDMVPISKAEEAFVKKASEEGISRLETFMKMEFEYLLEKGYILLENGLMVKK